MPSKQGHRTKGGANPLGTLSFDYPSLPLPLKIETWPGLGTFEFDYPSLPPPPENQGARMWRLISASPADAIWFLN